MRPIVTRRLRSATASATAIAPAAGADVGDPDRIAAPARARAGLAGPFGEPAHDLADRGVDEGLRLRARDQRPRDRRANARPWNSLIPRM